MRLFWRKRIETIQDIDELFVALTKRKHWKLIPKIVLKQIFDNADGCIEKVHRFRYVSELHHCVERNYLPLLEENSDPKFVLSLFSVTLERLAIQATEIARQYNEASPRQQMAIITTEFAYLSSILCNPLMLSSYGGLAQLYLTLRLPDLAAEVCNDFDSALHQLLSSSTDDLGCYNQALQSQSNSDVRIMINHVKDALGL
jgi:hypothetical protein